MQAGSIVAVTVHGQHAVRLQLFPNGVWATAFGHDQDLLYVATSPKRRKKNRAKCVALYYLFSPVILRNFHSDVDVEPGHVLFLPTTLTLQLLNTQPRHATSVQQVHTSGTLIAGAVLGTKRFLASLQRQRLKIASTISHVVELDQVGLFDRA
jgi:hypothetical protein